MRNLCANCAWIRRASSCQCGHLLARIRVLVLNSSRTFRELVVNNAVASQFVSQKWHDLPRQNRAQKSCKCQTSIMLVWHLPDSVARIGTTEVAPVRKLVVNWREVCVNMSWLRNMSGRKFQNVQNFGQDKS